MIGEGEAPKRKKPNKKNHAKHTMGEGGVTYPALEITPHVVETGATKQRKRSAHLSLSLKGRTWCLDDGSESVRRDCKPLEGITVGNREKKKRKKTAHISFSFQVSKPTRFGSRSREEQRTPRKPTPCVPQWYPHP